MSNVSSTVPAGFVVPKEEKLLPSSDPTTMQTVPVDIFGAFSDKMCDMTCRKCDKVPLMPLSLQCGCVFCPPCFTKISKEKKCTACLNDIARDEKTEPITAQVFMITGKLKTLKASCVHKARGCREEIIYGINGDNYKDHLKECKYSLVSCPDCQSVMSKSQFSIHKPGTEVCQDHIETCRICDDTYRRADTVEHKKSGDHIYEAMELLDRHIDVLEKNAAYKAEIKEEFATVDVVINKFNNENKKTIAALDTATKAQLITQDIATKAQIAVFSTRLDALNVMNEGLSKANTELAAKFTALEKRFADVMAKVEILVTNAAKAGTAAVAIPAAAPAAAAAPATT